MLIHGFWRLDGPEGVFSLPSSDAVAFRRREHPLRERVARAPVTALRAFAGHEPEERQDGRQADLQPRHRRARPGGDRLGHGHRHLRGPAPDVPLRLLSFYARFERHCNALRHSSHVCFQLFFDCLRHTFKLVGGAPGRWFSIGSPLVLKQFVGQRLPIPHSTHTKVNSLTGFPLGVFAAVLVLH